MEINIKDYMTNDEIRNIVITETQLAVQRYFTEYNIEIILSNLSYEIVTNMVNEQLKKENVNYDDYITKKVLEVIDSLTAFTVFRKKDGYSCNEDSVGRQLLDKACIDNKDTINNKVVEIINNIDLDDIRNEVVEIIAEKAIEMLRNKE